MMNKCSPIIVNRWQNQRWNNTGENCCIRLYKAALIRVAQCYLSEYFCSLISCQKCLLVWQIMKTRIITGKSSEQGREEMILVKSGQQLLYRSPAYKVNHGEVFWREGWKNRHDFEKTSTLFFSNAPHLNWSTRKSRSSQERMLIRLLGCFFF